MPIARAKKERHCAAALYSTESGHKTTSKSNEPVDDICRRVAMSRKGGYVGCATDASVGGKRIAFKLRRDCCKLSLRENLRAGPAVNHVNILA